jgi:hypothetical protein
MWSDVYTMTRDNQRARQTTQFPPASSILAACCRLAEWFYVFEPHNR